MLSDKGVTPNVKWTGNEGTSPRQTNEKYLQVTLEHILHDAVTPVPTSFLSLAWSKSKVTLVKALWLCTGRTANRGSRGIALLFLDYGNRRGRGVSVTPRLLFTPGKDPVPFVQEAGWALRPVWRSAENLAPIRIRSPDLQARSQ